MTTITFDTLAFVRQLKAAGFTETQSEAQADAINKVFSDFREEQKRDLATKHDLKAMQQNLEKAISELEVRLIRTILTAMIGMTAVFAAIVKLF